MAGSRSQGTGRGAGIAAFLAACAVVAVAVAAMFLMPPALQPACQTAAKRLCRPGPTIVPPGPECWIIRHLHAGRHIFLESFESITFRWAAEGLIVFAEPVQKHPRAMLPNNPHHLLPPGNRFPGTLAVQSMAGLDHMVSKMIIIQDIIIQHRKLLAVLMEDPTGAIGNRVLVRRPVQPDPAGLTTHEPTQRFVIPARTSNMLVPFVGIVEGNDLKFLVGAVGTPFRPASFRGAFAGLTRAFGLFRVTALVFLGLGNVRNHHTIHPRDQGLAGTVLCGKSHRKRPGGLLREYVFPLCFHQATDRRTADGYLRQTRQVRRRRNKRFIDRKSANHLPQTGTITAFRNPQPIVRGGYHPTLR